MIEMAMREQDGARTAAASETAGGGALDAALVSGSAGIDQNPGGAIAGKVGVGDEGRDDGDARRDLPHVLWCNNKP